MEPQGGTELQFALLEKHCPKELLDQVQICTSIPGKVPLHPTKLNILWQKNSWDQPNLQEFFNNKERHDEYDWYIFNSHWNYEKFRMMFEVPQNKCMVIKNATDNFPTRKKYKKGDPIKLLHHSTPWRGLNVMLAAMQYVKNPNITLDVYSSTQIYGDSFKERNDDVYLPLYEQARKLPNVNYIGYKPNQYLLDHMTDYQMWVYPSIWEETFCIGVVETAAAGLHGIVTNYGALFETFAEWPVYVNFTKDYTALAIAFAHAIDTAADYLHEDYIQDHLDTQVDYYKRFYSWEKKGKEWENFLRGALNARSKT